MDWIAVIVQIVVSSIVIAPVLWIAGKVLAGGKAKFTDAIWIVVLGVVIGTLLGSWLTGWLGWLGSIISFLVWLGLIKHFFDCGWIKAFIISILAAILFIVIWTILTIVLLMFGITINPPPGV